MHITLNGQFTATAALTLLDMINEQGFVPDAVIAEVNFELIKRDRWQQHLLHEGDTVELLSFVGGG
ncbi:MAG: sulfur carrier protein [Candidatus Electronema aureum]|uniref:Sulfur carrier protein n=1 Tax=Candidatus Electronema aureum TaxID=2005002 RepID=A0A521G3Y9_9BACT|nr:MAG: sulfur carrier protein [Candidatus Electronema aureum]